MTPLFYVDLSAAATTVKNNDGMSAFLPVMGRGFTVLHGVFSRFPGSYAMALPNLREGEHRHPGNVIRVFGETRESVDALLDNIEQHPVFKGEAYFRVSRVRQIPEGYSGDGVAYVRHRIPARGNKKSRKPPEYRARRLAEAERFPYFSVSSKSTKQVFSLHVGMRKGSPGGLATPDSYGLSTSEKPLFLPVLGTV